MVLPWETWQWESEALEFKQTQDPAHTTLVSQKVAVVLVIC